MKKVRNGKDEVRNRKCSEMRSFVNKQIRKRARNRLRLVTKKLLYKFRMGKRS